MAMVVNHNIPALQSYNAVTATNSALQKSIQKLSTGLRINSAADDAAGLAISEKMRAQVRGLDQAVRNSQDGISLIQTAEGALNEVHSILQRMRELSVQAANDTLTQQDRGYIQDEIDQLREEITRVGNTTQFNKKKLLDGSAALLWSSSDLSAKAIVNGGLRTIDQFGQKVVTEGNYKFNVQATAGEAQVQKTDIFKIKHEDVVINATLGDGIEGVRVDDVPAATYTVTGEENTYTSNDDDTLWAAAIAGENTSIAGYYSTQGKSVSELVQKGVLVASLSSDVNASVLVEVTSVGADSVTFKATASILNPDGTVETKTQNDITVNVTTDPMLLTNATEFKDSGAGVQKSELGIDFAVYINKGTLDSGLWAVGDKIVYNVTASKSGDTANTLITIKGEQNPDWPDKWVQPTNVMNTTPTTSNDVTMRDLTYAVSSNVVKGQDVAFRNYYLNAETGEVTEGSIILSFSDNFTVPAALTTLATFDATFVGQTAEEDVKLRDIDKFWDSQGVFMLTDAQTVTITQGNGDQAKITLYGDDTLGDVATKIESALTKLGGGKVAFGDANGSGLNSTPGTLVIYSAVTGAIGELSFAGNEDLINAFSLNEINKSTENKFTVDVTDAHTGASVGTQNITGNRVVGLVNANVDVEFDPMLGINSDTFDAATGYAFVSGSDSFYLHLADNTTIFQIGANEGEDMGINIGDMRSQALGLSSVLVTDQASAERSITIIDNAIDKVSSQRARLGAYQNRLEHTVTNLTTASENLTAAESRIRDTDMAQEMMNFTKLQILLQAGTSMLAQANALPQNVLSLLR